MDVFIEGVCEMRLVAAQGLRIPVPTRLSYSPYDPYAVHLAFAAGTASAATWVFARELLEVPPGRESRFLDLEDELCDVLEEVA